MLKQIQNGFKIGFTIIGTTIGAGFASGREIWEFFSSYGFQSVIGIFIAILLFALTSIFILWISYIHKTENYFEVLEILMGKQLARIFDGFVFVYLFSGSVIMFAGSGATFQQLKLPFILGIIILAIAVWLVLLKGVSGLMRLNSFLIPVLFVVLFYVTYTYFMNHNEFTGEYFRSHLKVWPSAITYAALNVVSLLGVLSTMGKKLTSKIEMVIGGVISTIFLGTVAILLNLSLLKVKFVQQYEIPLFSLVPIEKSALLYIVSIILWFAIYTTVLSNVHSLVHRLQTRLNLSTGNLTLLTIAAMIPLTFIGFSTLVNFLYPLYGVINLYLLAVLILYPFQKQV